MRRALGLVSVVASVVAVLLGVVVGEAAVPAAAAPGPARFVATPGAPSVGPTRLLVQRILEDRVLVLTNRKRRVHGCAPLRGSGTLRLAARGHSITMARHNQMSHQLPGEARFTERITRAGYRGWSLVAENVARGFGSPGAVVRAWMQSPSHRRNILNCRLRHLGVGVVLSRGQLWWTQDFGRP